jgi:hypothetical protein
VSIGNVAGNDRVSLFLMDYAHQRRLKIFGHMRVVDARDDSALAEKLAIADYPGRVERAILITVEAFDWNCPQHITPRFTELEIREALAPVHNELAVLRAENDRLRRELGVAPSQSGTAGVPASQRSSDHLTPEPLLSRGPYDGIRGKDRHAVLLCCLLQARCHIDRVAHDGELKTPGVPDNATEDLAHMHANPDCHRRIELPLRVPAGNEGIERSGTRQCPGSIIGRWVRQAEDNQRPVADEFVDDTAMAVGGIHNAPSKRAHDGGEAGRIQMLGHGSRAPHIHKEECNRLAPPGPQLRERRVG